MTRWIQEFQKLIILRQHIILYGNIRDHFLWKNTYLSIPEFLKSYFLDLNFNVVANYDPIETKWNFAQDEMGARSQNIQKHRYIDVPRSEKDFGLMFCLLSQSENSVAVTSENSVAVTVDLGDMLASQSIVSPGQRHPLIMLKKCTLEAKLIADGALKGYRNTLVILANELETVPQWFYRNNPFVSLLQVPLPKKEERREFALRFIRPIDGREKSGFYQGDRIQPDQVEILAEEFADLTEGFKNWDLETLRHTSWQAKIPLQANKVWQLVDFYKFGERNDPWEQLNKERLETASDELSKGVIGQESAIEAVTTMLSSARVGLSISTKAGRSGKPKGVFFFVGSTGVGKTELAKAMTKLVFGNEEALARFDMSEYREENADQKLIGAPPGYIGYESGGQLTNRVIEQPYSILLFDEIEKANPKILDKFLQILDDGRLTDGKGQTAYFNQTVIIFTSNIGASDLTDPQTGHIIRPGIMNQVKEGDGLTYKQVKEHFQKEVQWYFASRIGRAELLGRLGGIGKNIVVFDLLRPEFVRPIGEKLLSQLKEAALDKYRLNLEFQESIFEVLSQKMAEGDKLLMGGRGIKTELETLVEQPLNDWIFHNFEDMSQLAGRTLVLGITGDEEDEKLEVSQI